MSSQLDMLVESIREKVIEWEKKNWTPYPWRVDRDPYKVLVAELLLKRTTRQAVAREFPKFIARFHDINAIYNAPVDLLEEAFRHLGLYKQRARLLKELARTLVEKYGGRVPDTWEVLVSLPGLGVYIAGAVLSFGYGKRAPVVDSNAIRLLSRLTGLPLKKPEEYLDLVWALVPEQHHDYFNYGMIDLGAVVCHYREPRCEICPLTDLCVYYIGKSDTKRATHLHDLYTLLYRQGRGYTSASAGGRKK